jgi:phosphohistidine swiveling domain-containing protein
MVILTKFGMILAVAAVTSIAAIAVPTIVSAQNMTGNMTSGQNTTADIDQTGSISGRSCGDILRKGISGIPDLL